VNAISFDLTLTAEIVKGREQSRSLGPDRPASLSSFSKERQAVALLKSLNFDGQGCDCQYKSKYTSCYEGQ
jgi:hypothetical protein